MDIIDANEYLNSAKERLLGDAEYQYWFDELVKCRKAANECGFDVSKVEGVMYQLHIREIANIVNILQNGNGLKDLEYESKE